MTTALCDAFLRQVAPSVRARFEADASLAEALAGLAARARAECPSVDVDDEGLAAFVGTNATADTEVARLHAGDLRLALACVLGDPDALALFERDVVTKATAVVRSDLPAGLTLDDVLQRLRVRLLVRSGERAPGLATYAGRGSLVHWARAAAARLVQEHARAQRREEPTDDEAVLDQALAGDLDVGLLKRQYAKPFAEAFTAALAELPAREQNLLRLHYLDGMRADEIARIYATHRTTVWRWLTQCREQLLARTRAQLATRVPEQELSSLMNVVHSQLDVSLNRVLAKRSQ